MKTACKPFLIGFIWLLAMLPVGKAYCQSVPEPAIVVSMAPIQEQIKDTNYLVDSAGFGSMKFFIKTQIKHFTRGIDPAKPSGVLLYFEEDETEPMAVGFAPLSNLDDFLDTLSQFADVDDADEIITVTPNGGQNMMMKQVGGYIYIADNDEAFDNVPKNPVGMLGEMPTDYNIGVRVFGQRIPEPLREQFMDGIKQGYLGTIDRLAEDQPELAEKQRKQFEEQMDKIEDYIHDTDEIMFGFTADKDAGKIAMDFMLTALPNTEMANSFKSMSEEKESRFGGFLKKGAAMTSNMSFTMLEAEAEQYAQSMAQGLEAAIGEMDADGDFSESEIETIESASTKIVDALSETFKAGRVDSGAILMMGENEMNFASAMEITDPGKVEDAVKEIVELGESKMGESLQVNLNSGSHNGVAFHEVIMEVPEDEEEMQEYFGSEITMIVGIGKKEVYLAAGTNPMDTLKSAMDGTAETEALPVVYNFNLTPIIQYLSSVNGEPVFDDMIATLEESGRDNIKMYVKGIENGMHGRFEMDDGILGLIQTAVEAFQTGGFGGADDF